MEYIVIIEEDENGCSAYIPDLPGCIAAGEVGNADRMNQRYSCRVA